MKIPSHPWNCELSDAIAEVMAGDACKSHGVPGLDAPMRGLLDVLGFSPEIRARGLTSLSQRLNGDPLNIAAKKWLPAGWRRGDCLYILSLMLWGVTEAGIVPGYWETADLAGELIGKMMKWNPAYVMALLQNPEHPELADEEASLFADDLAAQETAEDAAWLLMEQLACAARNWSKPESGEA